jgi:hypothetical protein
VLRLSKQVAHLRWFSVKQSRERESQLENLGRVPSLPKKLLR